ncbi:MAG: potassium channel family protein [Alphaproteobacteria bacterium]
MSAIFYSIRKLLRRLRHTRQRPTARGIRVVLGALLTVALLHSVLIALVEDWSLADALWFTATAGTTVGFGDLSPASHLGRLITVLLIYIPAIPAIGYLTSLLVEGIIDRRDRTRLGRVQLMLSNHLVFINYPKIDGAVYFERAIEQFHQSNTDYADRPIAILTDSLPNGLPQSLHDLGVSLVSHRPNEAAALELACAAQADTVFVLTPSGQEPWEESLVFDIAHQILLLRGDGPRPRIIAEAFSPEMKSRLRQMGVDAVVRPIRAYPGLIVRAAIAPGSEAIVEALFDARGEECQRLDQPFTNIAWSDLASSLVARDLGTPIAIQDEHGVVRADLSGSERVSGRAVYLIVPSRSQESFEAAQQAAALDRPAPVRSLVPPNAPSGPTSGQGEA